jgi:hypothetical protein
MPRSICDVLPGAAAVLGVADAPDELDLATRHPGVRRVVVVLVDGMGSHLLPTMAPHAPFVSDVLAGRAGELTELSCTFPSTTPTSLVSLATGVRPGEHGVLGFTLLVPGTDHVLTHIRWRDDPDPATWQPVPTWFERIAAAGIDTRAVLPQTFAGTGLTEATYRGARFVGTAKKADNAQSIIDELCVGPGLVHGYTAQLDTAAHLHGIDSPQWQQAARDVDRQLQRIAEALPDDALLLVTADHGGLNLPADTRIDMDTSPELSAGIRYVAGEARVRYLHTQPGAADDVVDTWRSELAGRADVFTRDEAIALDLFGPVSPQHAERIGDVVVVCTGDTAILATAHEPPEVTKLVGFHGGLDDVEVGIPLIEFRP